MHNCIDTYNFQQTNLRYLKLFNCRATTDLANVDIAGMAE